MPVGRSDGPMPFAAMMTMMRMRMGRGLIRLAPGSSLARLSLKDHRYAGEAEQEIVSVRKSALADRFDRLLVSVPSGG